MSKTRIIIHIVFATKHRHQTIPLLRKRELYAYINGILKNEKCQALRINGMSDHIHLLIDLNPTVSVANLVKKIKLSSSLWLKDSPYFNMFEGWNEGYYAASVGPSEEDACIQYIINQEEHHAGKGIIEEMKFMAMEHRLDWDERDW